MPWVQSLPAPTHETCLCCSAKSGLMKLACLQPDSEAREAEAELGLGRRIWPALMADIGGTRYVTRGDMPFPNRTQRAPPARESVRVGRGNHEWPLPVGNKRGRNSERGSSSTSGACRCILVAWDGNCPWSVIQICLVTSYHNYHKIFQKSWFVLFGKSLGCLP